MLRRNKIGISLVNINENTSENTSDRAAARGRSGTSGGSKCLPI